ncbi:carbamoyltransferase C-terminal domain-containing protein [Mangrovibacterium diazotrophicum]|uniref:Carbamoyltransferase n=1 Tax=Mangrovibacterium diazotrophicum TaxID=1261403 RepID=A0A419WAF5_9BACT|nr:carbamoyltransferase C-terminal domain-containing protein [Mangrovibacterium diazotrophicum]RKD92437.1 carbamoyltransferase [Mangrovibacterium diazotrophicum]
MEETTPTLAIYGIQDRDESDHPLYVHDHNLCIMQNGRVRDFLQLERVSRHKHDNKLHQKLTDLLREKKLLTEDFDLVFVDNVVGRSFINKQGNVRFEAPLSRILANDKEQGKCWWYGREANAWVLNHELAHIFTCLPFYGNFKPNSLLVHFDGGASQSNFSAWLFRNNKLVKLSAHWDYKYLTSIFNANALVFSVIGAKMNEQNSVPARFIDLAGHGNYRYELETWLREHEFFENIWGKKSAFVRDVKKHWNIDLKSFDQRNPFIQDCLATLHELFVRETIQIFNRLQRETLARNLYYSGGCALNTAVNSQLIKERIFEEVFIPPCPDDSGLALGAAAFVEWQKYGEIKMHSPFLNNWGLDGEEVTIESKVIRKTAQTLSQDKIVGISNGHAEAGSRALGNRSLLAAANNKLLAQKLSMKCKGREWYRPLSCVMLEKNAQYFTGHTTIHPLSQYTLLDFDILPEKQAEIAGAVHKNGKARIQTIFNRQQNPFLWELLTVLDEKYNVKALVHASFNTKDDPIVHTEKDALKAANKMGISGLVLNGKFRELPY